MDVQIVEVDRKGRGLRRFLNVPYDIYRGDANWVPPLLMDLKTVFQPGNPLFQHARMKLWVAVKDGQDVGRIAALVDDHHLAKHHDRTGFWGFFESIDDQAVADALFDAASDWCRREKLTRFLGPMNPTSNDECGLLIDSFDKPPVFMMPYNPAYYVGLIERAGFVKAKDLLAYKFDLDPKPLERFGRIADGLARRNPDIQIKHIRKKTLAADLKKVMEVYNGAWEENWGFVPMTADELTFMGKRLKPMLVEEWALLAEDRGKPVAFMLCLPDYNEAIRTMSGKLLSRGLWKLIQFMRGKRSPAYARVLTLGILKEYRQRGIDAMFFAQCLRVGLQRGARHCEVSWMLEDNVMVLRPIRAFGGDRYKTYRLYERAIA